MEGLISARVNPIRAYCKRESSVFLPTFSLSVKTIGFCSKLETMRNPKSFTAINASVQPVEASKEGQFDNTLPSKGNF